MREISVDQDYPYRCLHILLHISLLLLEKSACIVLGEEDGAHMPLPLEEHVRMILLERDRGAQIYQALMDGWSDFTSRNPDRSVWVRKSTARGLMWEAVARRLRAIAGQDDGVEIVLHQDTMSLVFDDEVLFRLKHADIGLMTQNYPTAEAADFDRHEVDLFGRSGLQRVRLCYVLNEFETEVLWVGIAAHSERKFLWKIELNNAGAVAAPLRLPVDIPEVDTTRLVRLKPQPSQEDKKDKKNPGAND